MEDVDLERKLRLLANGVMTAIHSHPGPREWKDAWAETLQSEFPGFGDIPEDD